MEISYLGISFIESIMHIFRVIFEEVFSPVLKNILEVFVEYVISVIWSMWSEWLLALFTILCSLVDFLEQIFNVFAGVSPVKVDGQETYLLDAFFQMEKVTAAFGYITVMAVAICFIFTIYKTAKSISDMALEDRNPVSKVLANGMKAAVTFMLIPFLCIALLQIATLVTKQAVSAFNAGQGGSGSLGTVVFLSAGLDADKATTKRRDAVSGQLEDNRTGRNPHFSDTVRIDYLSGKKDYRDLIQVKKDFYASNFNFVEGFTSGVLMLFILAGAAIIFVRRLFEILLLYLVSPLFVSTIPLDDGATFARWRDLFVAKFFSGFGVIFSMRYYMLLVPTIAGSNLYLYGKDLPNSAMINSVLKMFMILGGAWAVYKSQNLILQILNQEAAAAEQQSGALMSGMIIGSVTTAANMAGAAASGGTTAALGGLGGLGSLGGSGGAGGGMGGLGGLGKMAKAAGEMSENDGQKYTGKS
ncbi:Mbov_0396 family ICE element transmembrane protein [Otoolea muris]|uniref:Mbov_0396 family ICE element transmembrane protein n=1 Tax=Otoolea muris TaxID=2941515 RepID=UPI00203EB5E3|nr:hypothetical protein [Otoolea muris]